LAALIVVLIAGVVLGLCFRYASQADQAKQAKEMCDHMRDHEERLIERLEIPSNIDQQSG
jgi:hypothetical protein